MIDLRLAVRNLLRNRRRSIATFIALVIGTASILLFGGYRKNIEYSMHTAYVRDGGHLQIQHSDLFLYGAGNPIKYSIAAYRDILSAIAGDQVLKAMVVVATPTLQLSGIASNFDAGVSRTVIGMGMVAADHNRMRQWNDFDLPLTSPAFALDGAAADAAIVGSGVARVLMLCAPLKVEDCPDPVQPDPPTGDLLPDDIAQLAQGEESQDAGKGSAGVRIELLASSVGGAPNVVSLDVIRAERQGFKELDEIYLMLQLPHAQRLIFGRAEPKVTAIVVQLQHTSQLAVARQRLQAILDAHLPRQSLALLDFRQLNPFFGQTVQMFDAIFGFIFVLIASIVLFTVSNTMNTAVMERTVEIGTIRAMGLRQRGVQRLFVLEGVLLGLSGAAAGALFALFASAAVNSLGLTWLPPGSGARLPLQLIVWGESATILGTTLGLILVAGLSAWWPARRASRLVIVDALRHV